MATRLALVDTSGCCVAGHGWPWPLTDENAPIVQAVWGKKCFPHFKHNNPHHLWLAIPRVTSWASDPWSWTNNWLHWCLNALEGARRIRKSAGPLVGPPGCWGIAFLRLVACSPCSPGKLLACSLVVKYLVVYSKKVPRSCRAPQSNGLPSHFRIVSAPGPPQDTPKSNQISSKFWIGSGSISDRFLLLCWPHVGTFFEQFSLLKLCLILKPFLLRFFIDFGPLRSIKNWAPV